MARRSPVLRALARYGEPLSTLSTPIGPGVAVHDAGHAWYYVSQGVGARVGRAWELSLLVRKRGDQPDEFPAQIFQSMTAYMLGTGKHFGHGHRMPLGVPLEGGAIDALYFCEDPDSQGGDLLRVVGITDDERLFSDEVDSHVFIEAVLGQLGDLVTDVGRQSYLTPELRQELVSSDSSRTEIRFVDPSLSWTHTAEGATLSMYAATWTRLVAHATRVAALEGPIILVEGTSQAVSFYHESDDAGREVEDDELHVYTDFGMLQDLGPGTYGIGADGLTIEVTQGSWHLSPPEAVEASAEARPLVEELAEQGFGEPSRIDRAVAWFRLPDGALYAHTEARLVLRVALDERALSPTWPAPVLRLLADVPAELRAGGDIIVPDASPDEHGNAGFGLLPERELSALRVIPLLTGELLAAQRSGLDGVVRALNKVWPGGWVPAQRIDLVGEVPHSAWVNAKVRGFRFDAEDRGATIYVGPLVALRVQAAAQACARSGQDLRLAWGDRVVRFATLPVEAVGEEVRVLSGDQWREIERTIVPDGAILPGLRLMAPAMSSVIRDKALMALLAARRSRKQKSRGGTGLSTAAWWGLAGLAAGAWAVGLVLWWLLAR